MNHPAAGRRRETRLLAGRAFWNAADQVVSSLTNLALSLLAARSLDAQGFGFFAIAFTIYVLLTNAGRSLVLRPLVVGYTSVGEGGFRTAARSATGVSTLVGVVSGLVTAVAGLVTGGEIGKVLLCMGALLPGLLLQDMWRGVFATEGRPRAAFVNDVVWGVLQFAAVAAILRLGAQSGVTLLLAWGGAACVAALWGIRQFGALPRLRGCLTWLLAQGDQLGYYTAQFLSVMGASQITLLLIGAVGSVSDVGALRAAQVVLGPLMLLNLSATTFVLPEISRRRIGGRRAVKVAVLISAAMVVCTLAWGAVAIGLPDSAGSAILGDTWTNAEPVIPATFLGFLAIAFGYGAMVVMMGRGYAKDVFWTCALLAPGFLVLGLGGLHLGGATGAALGLSLAQCVVNPIAWWRFLVLMGREENALAAPDVPAEVADAAHDADRLSDQTLPDAPR